MQTSLLCVLQNRSYCWAKIAEKGIFDIFAPVTLTLTRWPDLHVPTWPAFTGVIPYVKIFLLQGFRKLSSDRQTDRQTDTSEIIYHAILRGWSITTCCASSTLSRLRQQRRRRNWTAPLSSSGPSRASLIPTELVATLTGDTQQPAVVYVTLTPPRCSPSLTSMSLTSSPSDVTPRSRYATGSGVYRCSSWGRDDGLAPARHSALCIDTHNKTRSQFIFISYSKVLLTGARPIGAAVDNAGTWLWREIISEWRNWSLEVKWCRPVDILIIRNMLIDYAESYLITECYRLSYSGLAVLYLGHK